MGAAIRRELTLVGRSAALTAAVVAHTVLLTLFLVVWGEAGGLPFTPSVAFYDQFRGLELMSLALVLPWAVARCVALERGDDIVILAAVAGIPVSRFIGAKLLAGCGVAALVVLSALPPAVIAQQISALPWRRGAADTAALVVFGMAAAAITRACVQASGSMSGWLAAVLVMLSIIVIIPRDLPAARQAFMYGMVALLAIVPLMRSTMSVAYLSERRR
jgi:hypothetical protein